MSALAWLVAAWALTATCRHCLRYLNDGMFLYEGRRMTLDTSIPRGLAIVTVVSGFTAWLAWPRLPAEGMILPITLLLTCAFMSLAFLLAFVNAYFDPRSGAGEYRMEKRARR